MDLIIFPSIFPNVLPYEECFNVAKKILIIGAVALGPKAAARCKRVNPDIEILMIDQDHFISYGGCGMPFYLSGEVDNVDALRQTSAHVNRDPDFFRDVKGVEVRIRTKALAIQTKAKLVSVENLDTGEQYDIAYDELVIGTGSRPIIPNIAGNDLKNVCAISCLEEAVSIRKNCNDGKLENVVIIGGGFTGMEVAIGLAEMWDLKCTLIKRSPRLFPSLVSETISEMVRHDLASLGIDVISEEDVLEIRGENGVVKEVITSKRTLKADQVIFAMGVKPNSEIAEQAGLDCHPKGGIRVNEYLQTSDPHIYSGGDCVVMTNIISGAEQNLPMGSLANRHGRIIGTNIAGGNPVFGMETFGGVVGSWCVKLAKGTVAGTGLTAEEAIKAGFDAISVNAEQLDRAHFYPEKDMMTLEVTVDKKSRRVLGMQGYCANGISLKARIDTVAAMLQFAKPTLNDLSNVEIAYSPPLASAMDVINTVANVADNVLSGIHSAITPSQFVKLWEEREKNNYIFVDSRPKKASEVLADKYPDYWYSMPLEGFDESIAKLPQGKNIAFICNSGTRAYECQLKLKRTGRESVNSTGGMQAMKKRGQEF